MYRNIYYKIDDSWQGKIWESTWDNAGHRVERWVPHNSYLYYEDKNGKYSSIYRTKLKRIEFNSVASRKNWIKKNTNCRIFECLPPEREFLKAEYQMRYKDDDFRKFDLNVMTFDIECVADEGFSEPAEADAEINCMTFHNSLTNQYTVFITGENFIKSSLLESSDDFPIEYRIHKDEKEMLVDFMDWFEADRPDIITGWNIEYFDIPYLVNRLKRFFANPVIDAKLSPVCDVRKRSGKNKKTHRKETTYKINGITVLDYLYLYRDKLSESNEQFYTLDYISEKILGHKKLHNPYDSLKEFKEKDFTKFINYNIVDTMLVVELEEKLQLLKLAREICNIGLCEYDGIKKSSPYIYGALVLKANDLDLFLLSDNRIDNHSDGFEGAFVKETVPGFYRKGVAAVDFNSLYPNVIRTCNISPETKFAKITHKTDTNVTLKLANGNVKTISNDDLKKILDDKCTKSKNDVLYFKSELRVGVLPAFIEELYNDRVSIKKAMKKVDKKMEKMREEDPDNEELKTLQEERNRLYRTQWAKKIFLNTIYGQLGSQYFPIFDIDNAEAITLTGQFLTKSAMDYIEELLGEKTVIAGDTDSCYFKTDAITDAILKDNIKWTKKNIKKVCKVVDQFTEKLNTFCKDIITKELHSSLQCIEFARESFSTEADFLAKKKYVLHIRDDEGISVDKFKYTGVDVKKNEIPETIKNILREIIEGGIKENWSSSQYRECLSSAWEKFKNIKNPKEMAFIKNYSTAKQMTGFMKAGKGSQVHARASMYYNQLIEKMDLINNYEKIYVGDRMRYIWIKPNELGIDAIGFKYDFPKEFNDLFVIDYELMFEKIVLSPLKRFETNHKWKAITPGKEVVTDVMDL
jgi:DNA polymerase elongation subunit (family B)